MTETKALILAFAGLAVLTSVAAVVLSITDASGAVFGLVLVFLAALGGFVSSQVVMHYSALKERRQREEILLR